MSKRLIVKNVIRGIIIALIIFAIWKVLKG
jgi:hypothetical protein